MSDGPATQAIETYHFADDGTVPNNTLPLVVYRGALPDCGDRAAYCEAMFARNNWPDSWHNGIYSYHHYHSTAHEVLGCYAGSARVQFGGEQGVTKTLQAGDVVMIPAGVGHKNLGASGDFGVVGAYPAGQDYDMNYGRPGERPAADRKIERVPLPESDPVLGREGPLLRHWSRA